MKRLEGIDVIDVIAPGMYIKRSYRSYQNTMPLNNPKTGKRTTSVFTENDLKWD